MGGGCLALSVQALRCSFADSTEAHFVALRLRLRQNCEESQTYSSYGGLKAALEVARKVFGRNCRMEETATLSKLVMACRSLLLSKNLCRLRLILKFISVLSLVSDLNSLDMVSSHCSKHLKSLQIKDQ